MKKVNLLSRAEMRKVMGGVSIVDDMCLYCTTDQHSGCWYRKSTASNSMDECSVIYPNDTGLQAMFGSCSSGGESGNCTMN